MKKLLAVAISAVIAVAGTGDTAEAAASALSEKGQALEAQYVKTMAGLKADLIKAIPAQEKATDEAVRALLESDALDAKLVTYVVLHEATPKALALFAQQDGEHQNLVEKLLGSPELMKAMLVADGAARSRVGRTYGPAQYGPAMKIYTEIQKASNKASAGIFKRLAIAICLEHAVPRGQRNPTGFTDAPKVVDPVKRYLSYEAAYLAGELDPAFAALDSWNLRFVVDGEEPDNIAAWGREMLKNFRPDHVLTDDYGWRYVRAVPTEVQYGSGGVGNDKPELQFFQNILMNGGVCGRRAFFGRFILRAFGIPTTARPSRGHGALCHWTPKGWVVNLGPGWGGGYTHTPYGHDTDFLASTQARVNPAEYIIVKRAMWVGDVMGEPRTYGEKAGKPAFWNGVSLAQQRKIIEASKAVALEALGTELGESNATLAEKIKDVPVTEADKKIASDAKGVYAIPSAAFAKSSKDVLAMKSFAGGMQIYLPRFSRQGITVMRGGHWRGGEDACRSAWRMPSSGYGRYNNWGFRAAMTPKAGQTAPELTLDLGDGIKMEMVYIKPGSFIMGGTNKTHSKWHGVEVPKHEVTLTKGYYIGKYEVTQEQFQKIQGYNPSSGSKDPNAPADTIAEGEARGFCDRASQKTGQDLRLPTEAEWEYACRAGTKTRFFFGDDAAKLGDYAWYAENDGGKSHPVGQKKPNSWGLYDIQGNVCERVSDIYDPNYYAKSPKEDPVGPVQGKKSQFEYEIDLPKAGQYELTAQVVTANSGQHLIVSADGTEEATMEMPFTLGEWQETEPVTLNLKEGVNTLRFWRDKPPQKGIAIHSFRLTPVQD